MSVSTESNASAPIKTDESQENLSELEALRQEVQLLRTQKSELEETLAITRHSLEARQEEAGLPKGRRPEEAELATRPVVKEGELAIFMHPVCPFAHRAWIAAIEKVGVGGFRAIQIDLRGKPEWYAKDVYDKATVPALQHGDYTMGDSRPVCEWLEKTYKGQGTPLLPEAAGEVEAINAVLEEFGSKFVGPCYRLLKNQDQEKDVEYKVAVLSGAEWFNQALVQKGASPFFLGENFSMFEVLTFSFFDRFRHTLKHWRGVDVLGDKNLTRLHSWIAACDQRPSIVHSQRTANYYIKCYAGYAKKQRLIPAGAVDS